MERTPTADPGEVVQAKRLKPATGIADRVDMKDTTDLAAIRTTYDLLSDEQLDRRLSVAVDRMIEAVLDGDRGDESRDADRWE